MSKYYWFGTTDDELESPSTPVFDTAKELADYLGVKEHTIYINMGRGTRLTNGVKVVKVERMSDEEDMKEYNEKLKRDLAKMRNDFYYIAVDFDGTLVESAFPKIGKIREEVIERLRKRRIELLNQGKILILILWTCREDIGEGNYLTQAVNWCKKNGLYFNFINENPFCDFNRPDKVRKIYADEYWDDKAVKV